MRDTPVIKMVGITKRFAGVAANENVDFDLNASEIHSLLGENGAGKTTLMHILSGMYQPDSGTILVRGQAVGLRSPLDSIKLGIGMVYQHPALIPELTVLENLVLGFEGGFFPNLRGASRTLRQIAQTYKLYIDPLKRIRDLSVGERQRTEILKILFHESDVLILDEPTSMISPAETETLFHTLRSLRAAGKSIVLITHKLNDALAVSDRITIMQSGRKAGDLSGEMLRGMDAKQASNMILELMFGTSDASAPPPAAGMPGREPFFELKQVDILNSQGQFGLKDISLRVAKGEILGITGVDDGHRRLLAEVVGGQSRAVSGGVYYRGQDITRTGIAERFELGITYISEDRVGEGCVSDMNLAENSILQVYGRAPFSRFGVIKDHVAKSFAAGMIRRFGIRAAHPETRIGTLSGGNIQKFILARGLAAKPGLIVCSNPTAGLDTATVRYIHELLKKESEAGAAVLLITTDLDELFTCSRRIGVMFDGRLMGFLDRGDATVEKVGRLMVGVVE